MSIERHATAGAGALVISYMGDGRVREGDNGVVLGLLFSNETLTSLSTKIVNDLVPSGSGPRMVFTANIDHLSILTHDPGFREAYANAWAVTADGMPLYWYSKLKGAVLSERVTGSDLCVSILKQMASTNLRPYFVVNSDQTALATDVRLKELGFNGDAAYFVPPYGFENDSRICADLVDQIRIHKATHLFFCLGAPKSEIWCNANRRCLGNCYILPFGAGLEYFAGTKSRSPKFIQLIAMEWLWRLVTEPRRLAVRYLRNICFLSGLLFKDVLASLRVKRFN